METPIITRVSLEPFCPYCGESLEMQGEAIWWTTHAPDMDIDKAVTVTLFCSGCETDLRDSVISWRVKEYDAAS